MRHSIIATSQEAAGYLNGTRAAFYEVVKPQPYFNGVIWKYKKFIHGSGDFSSEAPFQVGQRIYVREQYWSGYELDDRDVVDTDKPITIYRADTLDARPFDVSEDYCIHMYGHDKSEWLSWKSAGTMPKSAARIWLEITGVECKRVNDITTEQAQCMLLGNNHIERMQYLHRSHNNIWDDNPWVFIWSVKIAQLFSGL